ncbi:MAG: hypothetical protein CVV03_03085 [Firmicutes bacterium HGW-Firmicutes-8]|nr:MAG: hypothetical protein CVV03_03085 [Firmicutes bacterium HGW-Firmicutes-8]
MIVREISLSDAAGVARVHVDSWRSTYRGIVSDDFINGLTYEKAMEHFISIFRPKDSPVFGFVAEVDGQIVGFGAGGPEFYEVLGGQIVRTKMLDIGGCENCKACGAGQFV